MYHVPDFDEQEVFELIDLRTLDELIERAYRQGYGDGMEATDEEREEFGYGPR
jgi:hypothetical protein